MRSLFVTPECYPLVKTGGLADVCGALPGALAGLGVDVRVLLPGYPAVLDGLQGKRTLRSLPGWLPGGGDAWLVAGRMPQGVTAYALEMPDRFDRPGNPYAGPDGRDWPDNYLRFAAFGRAAAWLAQGGDGLDWRPDILHGHDWQAGLAPAYLAFSGGEHRPGTVMTIHNIAYQGQFPSHLFGGLGLPPEAFGVQGVEYYGDIGYLKAGLYYADRLTTVSPTYAGEIQTPEGGLGLHGLLASRAHDLVGILNGVDYSVWNPATDPHLAAPYDADGLDTKPVNKGALQAHYGLEHRPEAPVFAVVSRLVAQKGIDLVVEAAPALLSRGAQLVILGNGDGWLEDACRQLAATHPGSVGIHLGYDEALSHRIQGGADVILVPSRFEPCGLTQLYGLRYGTLPLVRRIGGLNDTVVDATPEAIDQGRATGFVFDSASADALADTFHRAIDLYWDRARWRQVQRTAMAQDFGWTAAARAYRDLYRAIRPHA